MRCGLEEAQFKVAGRPTEKPDTKCDILGTSGHMTAKVRKEKMKCKLIIIALFCLNGCATSVYRFGENHPEYSPKGIYPAVKTDFNFMEYVMNEGGGAPWFIVLATGVGVTIDIPFSFVTDTILIPYDLLKD